MTQIFDCDRVTALVKGWQDNPDPCDLAIILDLSRALIEVLVSSYDPLYRQDLIQECNLRIQTALPYFNERIASLHTFLTTVIHNTCRTFMEKQSRVPMDDMEDMTIIMAPENDGDEDNVLTALTARNRCRFQSIPVDLIDAITQDVYCELRNDGYKARKIVSKIAMDYNLPRNNAYIIFHSTVIWLRQAKLGYSLIPPVGDAEFSLIEDVREIFGDYIASKLALILAGATLRVP